MRTPARILAVDDIPTNLDILRMRLESHGYEVVTAADGEEALVRLSEHKPDLVLLDIMMPKLDGIAVLKQMKKLAGDDFLPVILVTAKADTRDMIAGLEAGGDDYLTKPFEQSALLARVRSLLRVKQLHDEVHGQTALLREQSQQLADLNRTLEQRVAEQVSEIERIKRLERFLAPQLVQMIASSDNPDGVLASHRREITVIFCDLRGFTAFTDTSEPEEVMAVLREYHHSLGELIFEYEGTLDRFIGDGIMIVFNDPIPFDDHTARAVRLSIAMRARAAELSTTWTSRGHNLGFGVGIASGYATLGQVGFEKRREYTAIGRVTNLAARLCGEATAGQIVIAGGVFNTVKSYVQATPLRELNVKGFNRPVQAYEVMGWRDDSAEPASVAAAAPGES